jgi:DNA-directed RNA polymerase subunit RPC12/RpoP
MLTFLEKIKNKEKVDYKEYSANEQNTSLIDGQIAKYRDGEFKCNICGRMFFLILADGSKACFHCWQPKDESVYRINAEPLKGFKHIYPEKPVMPEKNKFFYAGGLESCFLYDKRNKQIECNHCDGELFTQAYNFETVCVRCGTGVFKMSKTKVNI